MPEVDGKKSISRIAPEFDPPARQITRHIADNPAYNRYVPGHVTKQGNKEQAEWATYLLPTL